MTAEELLRRITASPADDVLRRRMWDDVQAQNRDIVADLLRRARHRLHDDPVLSARAKFAARVIQEARRDDKTLRPDLEDDRLIAAVALVIAEQIPTDTGGPLAEAWAKGVTDGARYGTGTDRRLPDNPYREGM